VHAMRLHAARHQIVVHHLGAAGAERDVVFARATLVGMALDGESILRIGAQPLRLLVERGDRLRRQLRGIGAEEDTVADIDAASKAASLAARTLRDTFVISGASILASRPDRRLV